MSSKSNETKKKVLSIALKLIKEQGYDKVTINDICAEAEISKHTFYYYFTSKDDILYSFMELPRDICAENLANIIIADNSFEQYFKLIEPMIDFFADNGAEITKRIFIINLMRELRTFTKPEKDKFMELEATVVEKAQQLGDIQNQSEPSALIHTGFSLIISVVMFWCITGGLGDLKQIVRYQLETLFDVRPELRKAKLFFTDNEKQKNTD